jgi:hypothetical protein
VNRHGRGPQDHHEIDADLIEGWHFETAQLGLIARFQLTTLWLANG